nr:MAG TPA: hypothetical protein [Caudoviricetes sp.]
MSFAFSASESCSFVNFIQYEFIMIMCESNALIKMYNHKQIKLFITVINKY